MDLDEGVDADALTGSVVALGHQAHDSRSDGPAQDAAAESTWYLRELRPAPCYSGHRISLLRPADHGRTLREVPDRVRAGRSTSEAGGRDRQVHQLRSHVQDSQARDHEHRRATPDGPQDAASRIDARGASGRGGPGMAHPTRERRTEELSRAVCAPAIDH